MTKKRLLALLRKINEELKSDPEVCHIKKDGALLDYINSPVIEEAFYTEEMWYGR